MRRLCLTALVIGAATLAVLAALLFVPLRSDRSVQSPGGEFTAVVKTRLIYSLLPVMPGQGGDKPASVTMTRKDGRSCGSAELDMVSEIYGLRWELDRRPRLASIGPIVSWNLDVCRIAVTGHFRAAP